MNDYAKKVWKDSAGDTHDSEVEACAASRAHQIAKGMRKIHEGGISYAHDGLIWFLDDPEQIISDYNHVCLEVDKEMRTD